MKKAMPLTILLIICFHFVKAQSYYFRHYQVENGLSNSTVFCSLQDRQGFTWFGTKDGLNRFDGYHFKVFHATDENDNTLMRDEIWALINDAEGTLWVGGQKGLFRFDAHAEKLIPFSDSLKFVNELYIDRGQRLWFLASGKVCRYDFFKKQLKTFPYAHYTYATSICQDGDGNMWFSSVNGYLHRFDTATETFTRFDMFANSPKAASQWIEKIYATGKDSIFIGTSSQGIKLFNTSSLSYKDVLVYNPNKTTIFVRDILGYAPGEFWFATEAGIYIYNTASNKIINLKKKYQDPYSISDNAVYTLYKDTEGGVWAGTYFGGLNYFAKQHEPFRKFFPDYTKNAISGNVVREICEDKYGNLWLGTEDAGLNQMNTQTDAITHFTPTGAATSIAYSNIHGLLPVGDDLWIGTFEHGLDIMDIKTGKIKKHYIAGPGPNDFKSNFVVSLLQSKRGDIYIGTSNGLYRYIPTNDNFFRFPNLDGGVFISCLLEDHSGTVWSGTHDMGLFYFNPATGKKGNFVSNPADKNSLTTNSLNAIYEDSSLNLWFATEGGGLCRLDKERKNFTRYTTANGLPSNFVFKVLEDNKRMLWISTSKGLVNLDPITNEMIIYTKGNGLLNDQFNYNSGYKDAKGRLYFGSVKGMIEFNPADFTPRNFVSPVYLTGFQVHNKEVDIDSSGVLKSSILYTDKITLPYDQSSFSIDFAAPIYSSPERTEYSYKMDKLDREWTHIKSNRKVYFTNLEPGEYVFKVKATSNTARSEKEKELTIKILPPFWATGWAYLLYATIAATLAYYLINSYHKLQEDKKEKEIYEAKIEFFTNLAHEIRTPLTLIKGPVENLAEMTDKIPSIKEDVRMMERNTDRLINLVSQILDFRQTETKGFSLDFDYVNINAVLYDIYLTFEPLAKKRNLEYTIALPSTKTFTMADEEALQKIFTNLFSNAVKYSAQKVHVALLPNDSIDAYLTVVISNDGNIIPPEMREKVFEPFYRIKETVKQKGTGIGLTLARSLVELHKGRLFMEDDTEMNIFVVTLPLQTERIMKDNNRKTAYS